MLGFLNVKEANDNTFFTKSHRRILMRKKGTIDLTGCQSYLELFDRIYIGLELPPEECGHNWSAFWDSITGLSSVTDITVKGISQAHPRVSPYIEKMLSLLEKNKEESDKNPYRNFRYRVID